MGQDDSERRQVLPRASLRNTITYTNIDGYGHGYSDNHRHALSHAYLSAWRHARAMGLSQSLSDDNRALWVRPDCHAPLCVWWGVQWESRGQRKPLQPCHRNVGSARVDALCQ